MGSLWQRSMELVSPGTGFIMGSLTASAYRHFMIFTKQDGSSNFQQS
jgi:hypothetical protein